MSSVDLSSIPIPPCSSSTTNNIEMTTLDSAPVNPYWAKAQINLERIKPKAPSPAPTLPYFQTLPVTNGYHHQPASRSSHHLNGNGQKSQPGAWNKNTLSAASRLASERKLRDTNLAVAPPSYRNVAPNNFTKYPNFRPATEITQRPPMRFGGISYPNQNQPGLVTAQNNFGQQFVYSEFFNRMVPQAVKDYCDRSLASLPDSNSMDMAKYYLRERVVPLLDSGIATRVTWELEKLPHEVNFKLPGQWTPASELRGGASGGGGAGHVTNGSSRHPVMSSKPPVLPTPSYVNNFQNNAPKPRDSKFTPMSFGPIDFNSINGTEADSKKSKRLSKKERKLAKQQEEQRQKLGKNKNGSPNSSDDGGSRSSGSNKRSPAKRSRFSDEQFEDEDDGRRKRARAQRFASDRGAGLASIRVRADDDSFSNGGSRGGVRNAHILGGTLSNGSGGLAGQQRRAIGGVARSNLCRDVEKVSLKRRRKIVGTCTQVEKPYFRLTTEADPSQVRPYPILIKALDHVRKHYRTNTDYHYANDQLKSIRQDIMTQDIRNEFAITAYEEHVILASKHKDREEFNQSQQQLKVLYERLVDSPNRLRFTAYRLLYYIYVESEADATELLTKFRKEIDNDVELSLARKVYMAFAIGDYATIFGSYKKFSSVGQQVMDFFLDRERNRFLQSILAAYRPTIPSDVLQRKLLFGTQSELVDYLKSVGMQLDEQKDLDCRRFANVKIAASA